MKSTSAWAGVLAAVLLATGCATKQPTAKEEAGVWLSEAPRTLTLNVAPELPKPYLRIRDHKVGERVGSGLLGGVKGAAGAIFMGCSGGGLGCIVGLFLAPVGAVVGGVAGAVSVDSVDVFHPVDAAQGAPALYEAAVKPEALATQLAEMATAESVQREGARHRLSEHAVGDGKLTLQIRTLDLAGDDGEDPSVAILLIVDANLQFGDGVVRHWALEHRSRSRAISAWAENDAAAFRDELAKGMRLISAQLVQSLHEAPGFGAASKVAAARERKLARGP